MSYEAAYAVQTEHHAEVLAARESGAPMIGRVLLVEHDPPVITISRRPEARSHLIAGDGMLRAAGVTLAETDRGGDITYHGPGQLVAYPIVDLNHVNLGLHGYMRLLEGAVIECCAAFGVPAERDSAATGVWVPRPGSPDGVRAAAKVCAMGVRVRRWVSLHGLALNVTTNLDHFGLIVPCGLAGRAVTSLQRELGPACPAMDTVKSALGASLVEHLLHARHGAEQRRAGTPA